MIARAHRLTKEQLAALLAQKELLSSIYNPLGTLKYFSKGKALAVVTNGKHEKCAVVRNKIRRRIYSLFRISGAHPSGVFYVSKQSYLFDYKTTKKLFEELLSKITK